MAGLVGKQPRTKQPWRRLTKGQEEQEGPGGKDGGKESIQIIQFCLEELGEKGCNYSNFCKYVKWPVEPVFCTVYQGPSPPPFPYYQGYDVCTWEQPVCCQSQGPLPPPPLQDGQLVTLSSYGWRK